MYKIFMLIDIPTLAIGWYTIYEIFKIFMLIAVPVLIIGWIAYAIWMRKVCEEEKEQPKEESQRLKKTKSEISNWAQKMAQFKKPERKKPTGQDDQNKAE